MNFSITSDAGENNHGIVHTPTLFLGDCPKYTIEVKFAFCPFAIQHINEDIYDKPCTTIMLATVASRNRITADHRLTISLAADCRLKLSSWQRRLTVAAVGTSAWIPYCMNCVLNMLI